MCIAITIAYSVLPAEDDLTCLPALRYNHTVALFEHLRVMSGSMTSDGRLGNSSFKLAQWLLPRLQGQNAPLSCMYAKIRTHALPEYVHWRASTDPPFARRSSPLADTHAYSHGLCLQHVGVEQGHTEGPSIEQDVAGGTALHNPQRSSAGSDQTGGVLTPSKHAAAMRS